MCQQVQEIRIYSIIYLKDTVICKLKKVPISSTVAIVCIQA